VPQADNRECLHAVDECSLVRRQEIWSNYVKFQTALTNVHIITFVCNRTDVTVIDPNKLEVIEAVGCSAREVCI